MHVSVNSADIVKDGIGENRWDVNSKPR